jgi:GNAT superfamily N-acetyltransferase
LPAVPLDPVIRPMRGADVPAVERLTAEGFYELDLRTRRADHPEPQPRGAAGAELWQARMEHILAHDPGGCWVAEDDAGLVGAVASLKRDLLWILVTYVVRPGEQGRGIGKQLLEVSMAHGKGCLRGMIASSGDPAAARRYRLAGFTLHPWMLCQGTVDRALLPVVDRVREGGAGDIDLMNSVDRRVRDAAHGVDHESMLAGYRLVVVDRSTGSGYAYVHPDGGPYLLAATNRRTATDLLWESLAASRPDQAVTIAHITPANEWALDVGVELRMRLDTDGYLALRHMKPPMPYLPSGHFL